MGKDGEREAREGRHTPPTAPRLPDLLPKSWSLIAVAYLSSCLLEPLNFIGCLHQQDKKIPYRGFGTILTQAPPEGSSLPHFLWSGRSYARYGDTAGGPASLSWAPPTRTPPVLAHGISCLIRDGFSQRSHLHVSTQTWPLPECSAAYSPSWENMPGSSCTPTGNEARAARKEMMPRNILEGRPQHLQLGQA